MAQKILIKDSIKNQVKIKTPLFHKVLSVLKEEGIQNQSLLVAVSGGADSLSLLHVLNSCASLQNLKLYASYVHHGPSSDKKIQTYRDEASIFVSKFCKSLGIPCLNPEPSLSVLKNEDELRTFRYEVLRKIAKDKNIPTLVLAHNKNDVLETRLIHLIRGCAEQGFQSLKTYKDPYLRPLLDVSREDILNYLKKYNVSYLEDPSNQGQGSLRNWIRLKWLPLLEKKRPGSLSALSRSFSHIAFKDPEKLYSRLITSKGLKRDLFIELNPAQKKGALAFYMRQKQCKDYGLSHINEILKHLDRNQKNFNLRILKKTWRMSSQFIFIE